MGKNKCRIAQKRKNFRENGITLVALIITIIVMLILVAVTIQVVISSGLLSSASKAGKDYQAATEEEASMSKVNINNKEYNSIEEYVGTEPEVPDKPEIPKLPEEVKAGDYVNYAPEQGTYKVGKDATGYTGTNPQTFTTQIGDNALKWKILSIDEATGKIELVAETQTSSSIYFYGPIGYNHSVDVLNDLCKDLYSNSKIGAVARSINIEDIQAKTTYDFNSYIADGGYKYAITKKQMISYASTNRKYANIYKKELGSTVEGLDATGLMTGSEGLNNRVINEETGISTYIDEIIDANSGVGAADANMYATYTYVYYIPEDYLRTDLGVNNLQKGDIKTGTQYWLASRCVGAGSSYALFRLRLMGNVDYVSAFTLYNSDGSKGSEGYRVRPVVSLPSSVRLTKDTVNSTDDITYWNI